MDAETIISTEIVLLYSKQEVYPLWILLLPLANIFVLRLRVVVLFLEIREVEDRGQAQEVDGDVAYPS